MTAPVDPRPHAAPTDLVTAEDVAEWLRERAERALLGNCHPPTHVLHYALMDLRARLDRERRQACRRGARYEITIARAFWRAGGGVQQMLALAHVQCALAFRAAASAK